MSVRDTNTANTNSIKAKKGQLYSDACADVLRRYLELDPQKRAEERKKEEFQEAKRVINSFHPIQRQVMFGEDLIEKINHS